MSKGKFENLHRYFSQLREDNLTMTFEEIESIIGERLKKSAYKYPAYWYDSKTHILPKCWNQNGYKMEGLNLKERKVSFIKNDLTDKNNNIDIMRNNTPISTMGESRKQVGVSIDKAIEAFNKYYYDLRSDENARYLSWEHCYKLFQNAKNKKSLNQDDIDYLSLNLAFYLASWGMLRGSSFLLQKDYKVHIDVIKELYKSIYNNLWGIDYKDLEKQQNIDILIFLVDRLKTIYRKKRINVKEVTTDISDILITKVLLGTMGCIPAYDEYFKKGVGKNNITIQRFGKSSILGLVKYYKLNNKELEMLRKKVSKERNLEYPQMKILDMIFFQLGMDNK